MASARCSSEAQCGEEEDEKNSHNSSPPSRFDDGTIDSSRSSPKSYRSDNLNSNIPSSSPKSTRSNDGTTGSNSLKSSRPNNKELDHYFGNLVLSPTKSLDSDTSLSSSLAAAWSEATLELEIPIVDAYKEGNEDILWDLREMWLRRAFQKLDLDFNGLLQYKELKSLFVEAAHKSNLKLDKRIIAAAIQSLLEDAEPVHANASPGPQDTAEPACARPLLFIEGSVPAVKSGYGAMTEDDFVDLFWQHPELLSAFEDPSKTKIRSQARLEGLLAANVNETQRWKTRWTNWKIILIWIFLYTAANGFAFSYKAYKYAHNEEAQAIFGSCIVVARGAAQCLNLNCALILFPMARHFMTRLRRTKARFYFPFDELVGIHIVVGCAFLFWTCLHVGAHICDFHRFALSDEDDIFALMGHKLGGALPVEYWGRWDLLVRSRPGVTGIVMVLCALIAYPLTLLRETSFNVFWTSHHLLVVMLIALCIHGTSNLLEPAQSIFWLVAPLVLYLGPRFVRETPASKCKVIDASMLPGKCCRLRLVKPKSFDDTFRPGMYAYIQVNMPGLKGYEWHPFTFTSSSSEPFLEFHIDCNEPPKHKTQESKPSKKPKKPKNDWKVELGKHVERLESGDEEPTSNEASITDRGFDGSCWDMPKVEQPRVVPAAIRNMIVKVDGPIGASSQGYKDYPILMLVGGGVGVTPMISVLKDLLVKPGKIKRIYFYWTFPYQYFMEWFPKLIDEVYEKVQPEHKDKAFLQIRHFVTRLQYDQRDLGAVLLHHAIRSQHRNSSYDLLLQQQIHHQVEIGKPEWAEELQSIKEDAKELGFHKCGIFLCGPTQLADSVHKISAKLTRRDPDFHFHFTKETF